MAPVTSKKIALIQGHPDPDPGHLCRALGEDYAEAARGAGHEVTVIDVATLDFPMLTNPDDFNTGAPPPSLADAQAAILAADHLVVVFPLWLGTLPALTKGFFEQVLHRAVAFEPSDGNGWPKGKLTGKSARIIVTMGMPVPVFRIWFLSHGVKLLERSILGVVGVHPIRETLFGMVHAVSTEKRWGWIKTVRDLGAKGA